MDENSVSEKLDLSKILYLQKVQGGALESCWLWSWIRTVGGA